VSGHAKGNKGIDTAANEAPKEDVKPTWIAPATTTTAPLIAALNAFAGSGINPARLQKITGQPALAAAAPSPSEMDQIAVLKKEIKSATDAGEYDKLGPLAEKIKAFSR